MRSTTLSTLTLAAAMLLGACNDAGLTEPTTAPVSAVGPEYARGGNGKGKGAKPSNRIVYSHKDAAGATDIYAMNPDGTNVVRLTTGVGYSNFSPRQTADRSKIIFASNRTGAENIFSMNADGTGAVQLTFGGCADRNPAPSPDGTRIAFQRACAGGGIFVMNMDGSNLTQVTFNSGDTHPTFLPDGKIAFANNVDLVHRIWRMNLDGTDKGAVFSCGSYDVCSAPMFSPDGAKVALWSDRNEGEIIVYTPALGTFYELAHLGSASQYAPAFSPDGSKLVFTAGPYGTDIELYSVNAADGSGLTKLTQVPGVDAAPSWHR